MSSVSKLSPKLFVPDFLPESCFISGSGNRFGNASPGVTFDNLVIPDESRCFGRSVLGCNLSAKVCALFARQGCA